MSTSPKPEEVKDEAVDSSPEAIQAHLDQGSKLLALRKYELACDELSTAVELLCVFSSLSLDLCSFPAESGWRASQQD